MAKQFSIAEAKSKLPAIIHSVEDGPSIELTRHGKPVAMLISIREYDLLVCKKKGFWNALMDFRKSMENEGVKVTDEDFEGLRDISHGRDGDLYR